VLSYITQRLIQSGAADPSIRSGPLAEKLTVAFVVGVVGSPSLA